jgi:heterodisulfide reductase subunit C
MTIPFGINKADTAFIEKVEKLSGQNILACYQCGRCSAGCPMAPYMDILPNQLIRLVQLGISKKLLESKTIWACASCFTCNARCPKGVNIAEVIEAIRLIQLRQRKDHMSMEETVDETGEDLPPIALISAMRKFTS